MVEVYAKCRDLFSTDPMPMWEPDVNDTPAVYKADIKEMTSLDCHKLKRELANEVAEEDDDFAMNRIVGVLLAFGAIVMLIILLCRMKRRKKISDVPPKLEPEKAPPILFRRKKRTRTADCKSWMRRKCRPIFLHNEAQIRQYKEHAEKELAFHTERTKKKITMWTKARERDAQKKIDKQQRNAEKAARKNQI
ncbi:uncharacterized protein LOC108114879 [Drosophila eugracilis]|uniref:uncharacterized protein LOC108114879 n=1 Tax=Drosophila eugracilis TaxID=29029 RepID=UPI001BD928B5|nr:uncharacterized protein LOC108114879 [Drosophila eugracilis]